MRIKVDKENDALYFRLDETTIVESEEVRPGVILDYNAEGPSRRRRVSRNLRPSNRRGIVEPAISDGVMGEDMVMASSVVSSLVATAIWFAMAFIAVRLFRAYKALESDIEHMEVSTRQLLAIST